MTKSGVFILVIFQFFLVSISAREIPSAIEGVLDLRSMEEKSVIIPLSGEWEFYWKDLILPGQFSEPAYPDTYANIPSYWTDYREDIPGVERFGYATYRLRILLPENFPDSICLQIPIFDTSYELYLNGALISSNGKVGITAEQSAPGYNPVNYCYYNRNDTLELVLHVSNYFHRRGGFWLNMMLGEKETVLKRIEINRIITYSITGILFGTFLLFLAFYGLERQNTLYLWFSLATLGILIRMLYSGNYPVHFFWDHSWELNIRLEYIGLFAAAAFGILYMHKLYPSKIMERITIANAVLFLVASVLVMLLDPSIFTYSAFMLYVLVMIFFTYYLYRSFREMLKGKPVDIVMFIFFAIFLLIVINDILIAQSKSPFGFQYRVSFIYLLFVVVQVLKLLNQWQINYRERLRMHSELLHMNRNLESIIDKRTLELNKTNKELTNALGLKNRMFSIIAHDLKSPIASLAQYADLMVEEFGDQKNAMIIHELRKLSYASVDLIENMLHWGMKQEGSIQYHPESVALTEVMDDLTDLNQRQLQAKNIHLEMKSGSSTTAWCDPSLLKITLRNLLTNAIKFTPEKGTITLETGIENNKVFIRISDTGIGMDQEKIDRILKDQADTTRGTAGEKGTGLGLLVVRDLVEVNNGTLHIESKPGRGTTVVLSLPGKP